MVKYKERHTARVLLPSIVTIETSYISQDECFAALQIDLGWRCVTSAYRFDPGKLTFR